MRISRFKNLSPLDLNFEDQVISSRLCFTDHHMRCPIKVTCIFGPLYEGFLLDQVFKLGVVDKVVSAPVDLIGSRETCCVTDREF
jgi:hypothetical protein